MKPKVSKETELSGTRLRSNPQSRRAPRTLPWWSGRESDRASRYHTRTFRTRGAVSGEAVITENRSACKLRCSRNVPTVLPSRRPFSTGLPGRPENAAPGLGGGRGLSCDGGARARGHSTESVTSALTGHAEGGPGRRFPQDSKAQLRGQSGVRGAVLGARRLGVRRSETGRSQASHPAAPVQLWGHPGTEDAAISHLPALQHGMVSAQALGSSSGCPGPCRWTSGPETGPAWRSWRAGRRWTSSSPSSTAGQQHKQEGQGQADGRGPGGGESRKACFCFSSSIYRWSTDPKISPRPGCCRGASTQLRRQINCAGASCFHVHNRQPGEFMMNELKNVDVTSGRRLAYSYWKAAGAACWNWLGVPRNFFASG